MLLLVFLFRQAVDSFRLVVPVTLFRRLCLLWQIKWRRWSYDLKCIKPLHNISDSLLQVVSLAVSDLCSTNTMEKSSRVSNFVKTPDYDYLIKLLALGK